MVDRDALSAGGLLMLDWVVRTMTVVFFFNVKREGGVLDDACRDMSTFVKGKR